MSTYGTSFSHGNGAKLHCVKLLQAQVRNNSFSAYYCIVMQDDDSSSLDNIFPVTGNSELNNSNALIPDG